MTRRRDPTPHTSRPGRSWLGTVLVGILTGWLLASAVVVLGARGDLTTAQRDLGAAEAAVRRLDVPTATASVADARDGLVAADAAFARPLLAPWRVVPVAARNLRVVRAITDEALALTEAGGGLLARAGDVVTSATDRAPGAPLPITDLGALADPLADLADVAGAAEERIVALDSGALLPPVRDAFATFTRQAGDTAAQARTAGTATRLTAELLGAEGPRRYFVGAATPAELRGTGGLIGAWSVMEVEQGGFSFQPFTRILDLVFDSVDLDVTAPTSDYADRYAQYDALADWRNTTMTPDFPSAAVVMERLWRRARPDIEIDGVLVIDPVAFQLLAGGAQELRLAGGLTVPTEEIVEFVTNGAYEALPDDRERREAIGEVATASLQRLVTQLDEGDLPRTLDRIAGLFGSGHALVHSQDAAVQELVMELGVGGGLVDAPGDELGLALNNGAGNKVDYWLDQRWDVEVVPLEGGDSLTTMTVTLKNDAPRTGFSQEVLGPFVGSLGAGDTLLLATAMCGPTCEFVSAPDEAEATTDREQGFGLNDEWVRLPSGETDQVTWSFRQSGSWSVVDGVYRHELHVVVPPTVRAPDVTIDVRVPARVVPHGLPDTARVASDGVRWLPGAGSSSLVITNEAAPRPPSLLDALRRPASSLF